MTKIKILILESLRRVIRHVINLISLGIDKQPLK